MIEGQEGWVFIGQICTSWSNMLKISNYHISYNLHKKDQYVHYMYTKEGRKIVHVKNFAIQLQLIKKSAKKSNLHMKKTLHINNFAKDYNWFKRVQKYKFAL